VPYEDAANECGWGYIVVRNDCKATKMRRCYLALWDGPADSPQGEGNGGHAADEGDTADGQRILTASDDGTIRLWDGETGQELCAMVSFNTGKDWFVVTPEGLFDGSEKGRQKVMFRTDGKLDVVPAERFAKDFYRPGLLADIWKGKRPLPGNDLPPAKPR
jgi:hypothetical protein